jgi:hypothetical protein
MDIKNRRWMEEKILEFMTIIDDCLNSTTYANDRPIYMSDLVTAARWLIKLYKGESVIDIYHEILSDKTNKHFGDYWRYDPWGENEATALATLQEKIRNKFNLSK